MPLILASTSPRRHELLAATGLAFDVLPSPAEEIHDAAMAPQDLCEENAFLKAQAVALHQPHATVIGADTLVFIDQEPLGKPKDLSDARAMLRRLSNRTHFVCTGVCVIEPTFLVHRFHDITQVTFRPLTDEAIEAYVSKVNPLDKAGSYGIQEFGDELISHIQGSFDTVMGLPVAPLLACLQKDSSCARSQDKE